MLGLDAGEMVECNYMPKSEKLNDVVDRGVTDSGKRGSGCWAPHVTNFLPA